MMPSSGSLPPCGAGQSHMSTLHLGGDEEVPLAPYLPLKRGGRRAGPFGRARRVGINARPRRSPPGAQERADLPFSMGGMEQVAHEFSCATCSIPPLEKG